MIDLKNYVAKNPQDAGARAKLALALMETGDVDAAAIEISKAKDLGADAKALVVPECRLLVMKSSFEQVAASCADVGDPALDPDLAMSRGEALMGLGKFAEARVTFEQAAKARPDSLRTVQGMTVAAFELEGPTGARKVLQGATPAVKAKPQFWLLAGSVEMRGGDFAAAESAFQTALEKIGEEKDARDRLAALGGLAESQLRQNKMQEAVATSTLLLKAAPKNPLAKLVRAQAAAGSGDLATARTLLEEAVSADPNGEQARLLLGLVNMQQGNLGQAEMHLAQLVNTNPENTRAQQLLAMVRSRLGSPEQTLAQLQPTLDQPDPNATLLMLAGELSLQDGKRAQAVEYLDKAGQRSEKMSPDEQLALAGGYLAAGEADRAAEVLESMLQAPADAGSRRDIMLLAALLQQGKSAEALARADEFAKLPDSRHDAHSAAGAVYASAGKSAEARAEWNKVLKAKPEDTATRLNLVRLEMMSGDTTRARAELEKILAYDPKNLSAVFGLANLDLSKGDAAGADKWLAKAVADHPDSVEVLLAASQFRANSGSPDKALTLAESALKLAPKNGAALNAKGFAEAKLGRNADAINSFKQAVEAAPRDGHQANLARAYLTQGKTAEALAALDDLVKNSPRNAGALTIAASLAIQAGDTAKARGYVDRLKAIAPDAAATLRAEGDLAMSEKRFKDALVVYEKAAAKGNDSKLAVARYQAASAAQGKDPQRFLEEWLAKAPKDGTVWALLGDYEQRQGDTAAAAAAYEKAIANQPGNVIALNNLAGIYQAKGDARALDLAKRAHDAAPKSDAVLDTYGWALVEAGRVDEGLKLIEQAAKSMSSNAEVQYHLGVAFARKGRNQEAVAALEAALSLKPPAPIRDAAAAELKKLKP